MKLTIFGIVVVAAVIGMVAIAITQQTGFAQTASDSIKVRGCLAGGGTDENPWMLRGAVLPAPPQPAAAPAAAPAGGRGDGGRGAAGRGGGGGGGGRGGDGAQRGAPPAAAAAPAPASAPPAVNLKLTGMDLAPWRNMVVEVEGKLGPRPANGAQEFRVDSARSVYGDCR